MCGGIGFNLADVDMNELLHFYEPGEIEEFKKAGIGLSFFWNREPVLPIKDSNNKARLVSWGNRDKNIKLPKTGWAKSESINSGKWDYLKPEEVIIPAIKGYEKGLWFPIGKGIKGIVVDKDGEQRIYMVTRQSSAEYQALTKHDREPDIL